MNILGHFKQKGFVGIDLGSYAIKVAEVLPGKTAPMVKAFGQIRLPAGCISGGVLKEPEVVTAKLRKLIANLRLSNKRAVISLSSYAAILKRVHIDLEEGKDLEHAIYEEAEAQIPFNLEDVYIDYQLLSEDESSYDVLLVAARKEIVDEVFKIIRDAGLKPVIIDIDLLAIGNLVEYIYQPDGAVIIIDIGATKSSVILWEDGSLVVSRDIAIGSYAINDELRDLLNLSPEDVEKMKISGPEEDKEKEILKENLNRLYSKFGKDLENTLDYFSSLKGNMNYEQIYLCGGGSFLPKLAEFLRQRTGKRVDYLAPFVKLELHKDFDENYCEYLSKIGSVSLGLGIRELVL